MDANTNTQDQGTQGQVQDQSSAGGDTTPAKVYPTKADADAARPANASKALRPFEVSKNGTTVGWVLDDRFLRSPPVRDLTSGHDALRHPDE